MNAKIKLVSDICHIKQRPSKFLKLGRSSTQGQKSSIPFFYVPPTLYRQGHVQVGRGPWGYDTRAVLPEPL